VSWLRRLTVVLLVLAGLAGLGGGGAGLVAELTRHATHAEAVAALRKEIASRWRRLPAGQIFKPAVTYNTSEGVTTVARRVGIAPAVPCTSAADPEVTRALVSQGCVTVLRATYVDQSGTLASTEGIAVMPGSGAAAKALAAFHFPTSQHRGVNAVPFRGTLTHLFGNRQRSWFGITAAGPYVFLSAGGYTSARSGRRNAKNPAFGDLSNGIVEMEMSILTAAGDPCRDRDIRC
jgi:hypothetical protein